MTDCPGAGREGEKANCRETAKFIDYALVRYAETTWTLVCCKLVKKYGGSLRGTSKSLCEHSVSRRACYVARRREI